MSSKLVLASVLIAAVLVVPGCTTASRTSGGSKPAEKKASERPRDRFRGEGASQGITLTVEAQRDEKGTLSVAWLIAGPGADQVVVEPPGLVCGVIGSDGTVTRVAAVEFARDGNGAEEGVARFTSREGVLSISSPKAGEIVQVEATVHRPGARGQQSLVAQVRARLSDIPKVEKFSVGDWGGSKTY